MSFFRRITGLIPLRVKPEVSGKGIWLNRTIPDTSHKISCPIVVATTEVPVSTHWVQGSPRLGQVR
jgi:hypothetical protein